MKKKTALLLFLIMTIIPASLAQGDDGWRKKYINLGFINTTMSQDGRPDLKSNYGVSFAVGRTFYLHKPIRGVLRFGINVTWLDVNYTNYKIKHITYWRTDNYTHHQGEVSMHVGPSITYKPIDKLDIQGYFRYAPSFSALYADDAFYGNYATFFVAGTSVSYGAIGLGIESRFGRCKYEEFKSSNGEGYPPIGKIKHNGWKAYLTFNF